MKSGLIFCGWGTRDLVARSLAPWLDLRNANRETGHNTLFICAVSVRFAGFEGDDDGTREFLRDALARGDIDHLIDGPDNIPETTARSMALNHIKGVNCDISIMWDSDEVATIDELVRALGFMKTDKFTAAWRFSYRNLVFSPDQWLADPFTPMRAHRLCYQSYVADKFYDDNNVMYRGTITRDFRQDVSFPTVTIPPTIMNPAHWTWLSNQRSRNKVEYQTKRGWRCSFAWDEVDNKLVFNPALPTPKTVRD